MKNQKVIWLGAKRNHMILILVMLSFILFFSILKSASAISPEIVNLGDNSWVKLETPSTAPDTRGYSPFMPYAPDLKKAFLFGSSHGDVDSQNEVWTYDMETNTWQKMYQPDLWNAWKGNQYCDEAMVKDGILMTSNERPWGTHTRYHHTYIPGQGLMISNWRLYHITFGWCPILGSYADLYQKMTAAIYDSLTNKWKFQKGGSEAPNLGDSFMVLQYIPELGKVLGLKNRKTWFYDPQSNVWESTNLVSPPNNGDMLASYNPKNRILFVYESHGEPTPIQWAYFVDQNVWKELALPIDKTPGIAWVGAQSHMNYDQTNNVHVMFRNINNSPEVWVYDLNKNIWGQIPQNGLWPVNIQIGESYYDPVYNAFLFYIAATEGKGQTWIYRYKNVLATPDTSLPSTPTNLTVTPVSSSQINLAWTASTDNIGVTGYKIYRCAGSGCVPTSQIATSAVNSYSNTGLTANTAYTYAVSAYDVAGNESGKSSSVSGTTIQVITDTTPPTRSNGQPTGTLPTGTTSTAFSLNTNENATCKYSTTSGTSYSTMTNTFLGTGSTSHSKTISGLTNGTSYTYYIRCQDTSGNANTNDYPIAFSVTSVQQDTAPPSAPTNLQATPASSSQINLSWTASTDNIGVVGYKIYRSGSYLNSTTNTSYQNTGLSPSTAYTYTVSAYDVANNESIKSISVLATTLSIIIPLPQSGLNIPITIKETAGVGDNKYPITAVVPLSYGHHYNTNNFRVVDSSGSTVPAQFYVLNRWGDIGNSIRHLSINFQPTVSAFTTSGTGITNYFLRDDGFGNTTNTDLTVNEDSNYITVVTGPLKFKVRKNSGFNILDEVWLDQNNNKIFENSEEIVSPNSQNGGVFVGRLPGDIQLDSSRNDVKVEIEEQGPMQVVIRAEALTKYNSTTDHTHGYAVRIYAYAGKPFLKIDYQLQNSAKNKVYAWPLYFEEMNLDFALNLSTNPSVKFGLGNGSVYTRTENNGIYLAQDLHNTFKIYDKQSQAAITSSAIADGFIDVSDSNRGVTAMIRYFGEMWPNGLEVDNQNKLSIQLFPRWSAELYSKQISSTGLYWLEDMQNTYKEVMLYFHDSNTTNTELINLAKTFTYHPIATLPTGWYQQTQSTLTLGGIIPLSQKISVSDERKPTYPSSAYNLTGGYYQFGWDNFKVDVNRKNDPSMAGNWPYSASSFIATENPSDYYSTEQFAIGELNVLPQWLAQYSFDQDWNLLQLSENPYAGGTWRKYDSSKQPLDALYLNGTGKDAKAKDDQHAWFYHLEEAYYLTGNPWIKDWYEFVAEFRKTRLNQLDPFPDRETRAVGHSLANALQAYRVTGDTQILQLFRTYLRKHLRPSSNPYSQDPYYGNTNGSEAAFQVGFLARAVIDFMEEVKEKDPQAWAEAFNYLSGQMEWNYNWSNFAYYISPGETGLSSGEGTTLADAQAWYYWHTGKKKYLDQLNQYINTGINGGSTPIGNLKNWSGDFVGRLTQFVRQTTRPDLIPPSPITDLITTISGLDIILSWTMPADVVRSHIVWSDKPISENSTTDKNLTNWWAANVIGTTPALQIQGSKQSVIITPPTTNPFYAAVFSFDENYNMSLISNVALAGVLTQDTSLPTIPQNLQVTPVSSSQINLAWTASTDNIGVTGYKIYRCAGSGCVPTSQIATSAVNSYSNTGLTANTAYTYAVSAYDVAGNESGKSSSVSAVTQAPVDTTAPIISNVVSTNITTNSAKITWITNEPADSKVDYGLTAIYGQSVFGLSFLTSHSLTLTNLSDSATYNFRVQSKDAAGNTTQSINYTFITQKAVITDTVLPSAITNLSASNITQTSVDLGWTASGNDGDIGTASAYDIRYSTLTITEANWGSATQVTGEPTPLSTGASQLMTIVGLSSNTTYYFAIKTRDEVNNWSGLSNVVSARTQSSILTVLLSANPNYGTAPLNGVDLTATISGTTQGNINYTFYCNRSDSETNITTPYAVKYDNIALTTETATDICSYSTPGTYTAKVIIERGGLQAENRVMIIVSAPTVTLPPAPTGGGGGGSGGMIIDTTPPSQTKEFKATGAEKQISLSWQNPVDSDFVRVLIIRKEGSAPISRNDGAIIYEGNFQQFTDINLDNTKTYYYAIYAYDKKPNYSQPVIISAKPEAGVTQITLPIPTPIPAPASTPLITTLTGPFATGTKSDQVKILQQMLSQDKEIYPEGIVSGYYGSLTVKAIQRFQCKYGIVCSGTLETTGYGLAGPKTRIKINEILKTLYQSSSGTTGIILQDVSGLPSNYIFTEKFGLGQKSQEVKYLQIFLKNQGTDIYPEGLTTGYYGGLTVDAIKRFQCKYGIVCSGTPTTTGYGLAGPKTRIKINEILKTL